MSPKNDSPFPPDVLPITEVERQTGIRQATLRMWEKRYGFPRPLRDQHGDRIYPLIQVERLLAARRLLDQGIRPGKIFSAEVLPDALAPARTGMPAGPAAAQYLPLLELVRTYRLAELHSHFQYRLLELGLRRFVIEFLAPLSVVVGAAWARGELPVRCEHLYSQVAMSFLHDKQAGLRVAGGTAPKAVLATLTGEAHMLGILMVEAVLATCRVDCVQLGGEVPPLEVAAAATECAADIVALSFSSWFPRKSARRMVQTLRETLPPATELWVGGDGAPDAATIGPGVYGFASLEAIQPALLFWKTRMAG